MKSKSNLKIFTLLPIFLLFLSYGCNNFTIILQPGRNPSAARFDSGNSNFAVAWEQEGSVRGRVFNFDGPPDEDGFILVENLTEGGQGEITSPKSHKPIVVKTNDPEQFFIIWKHLDVLRGKFIGGENLVDLPSDLIAPNLTSEVTGDLLSEYDMAFSATENKAIIVATFNRVVEVFSIEREPSAPFSIIKTPIRSFPLRNHHKPSISIGNYDGEIRYLISLVKPGGIYFIIITPDGVVRNQHGHDINTVMVVNSQKSAFNAGKFLIVYNDLKEVKSVVIRPDGFFDDSNTLYNEGEMPMPGSLPSDEDVTISCRVRDPAGGSSGIGVPRRLVHGLTTKPNRAKPFILLFDEYTSIWCIRPGTISSRSSSFSKTAQKLYTLELDDHGREVPRSKKQVRLLGAKNAGERLNATINRENMRKHVIVMGDRSNLLIRRQ